MKVYLYTRKITERLSYIAGLLLGDILVVDFELTDDYDSIPEGAPVIAYDDKEPKGLQIVPSGLLFEKQISDVAVKTGEAEGEVTLFPVDGPFPFDVFSAAFYIVSRYEEYLPHKRDKHNRFDPEHSIAHKLGFLDKPIVHVWAEMLGKALLNKYPGLSFGKRQYTFINTIDVDYAYAYLGKGFARTAGAFVRDLFTGRWDIVKERAQVLAGLAHDPFDTFGYLLALHKEHALNSIFFFHVGDYDVNDKSVPLTSSRFVALIKSVNDYATIGIHPSFKATTREEKLRVEINRLAKVIHQPVTKSRFHFLRFNLPSSYRSLIKYGITEDYTMGYASMPGFRAGVCIPYKYFDLDLDISTNLTIYPIYLMEATLKYYMNLDIEEAKTYFDRYIETVRKYNGVFIGLWHNDSLSGLGEWAGWRRVYENMLEKALP